MKAKFFIARHAEPTKDEQDITDRGRDQAHATAEAHLKGIRRFQSLAWSGEARTRLTLLGGLLSHCKNIDGVHVEPALAWNGLYFNPAVPASLTAPSISAAVAKELHAKYKADAIHRFQLLALMERTIRQQYTSDAMPTRPFDINCLWVSHKDVIEPVVSPDIEKMPDLGHADILKVEWVVQGLNDNLTFRLSTTEVLRCPIRSTP